MTDTDQEKDLQAQLLVIGKKNFTLVRAVKGWPIEFGDFIAANASIDEFTKAGRVGFILTDEIVSEGRSGGVVLRFLNTNIDTDCEISFDISTEPFVVNGEEYTFVLLAKRNIHIVHERWTDDWVSAMQYVQGVVSDTGEIGLKLN